MSNDQGPLLVSFSGVDGAGKSTQIEHLRSRLRRARIQVELVTFWDDVASLKQVREDAGHKLFKGDRGVGTPEAPIQRRDKNVRSPWLTLVRMGIYLSDVLALRRVVRKALRSQADVIIFDRYIYDELANLNPGHPLMRLYIRTLMKLAPRPHVSIVLDADPVKACARKPEYPVEFVQSSRASYLALGKLLGGMTVIPPMELEDAKAEVVSRVMGCFGAHRGAIGQASADELFDAKTQWDEQSVRPISS